MFVPSHISFPCTKTHSPLPMPSTLEAIFKVDTKWCHSLASGHEIPRLILLLYFLDMSWFQQKFQVDSSKNKSAPSLSMHQNVKLCCNNFNSKFEAIEYNVVEFMRKDLSDIKHVSKILFSFSLKFHLLSIIH